jgi:hypothetical protein
MRTAQELRTLLSDWAEGDGSAIGVLVLELVEDLATRREAQPGPRMADVCQVTKSGMDLLTCEHSGDSGIRCEVLGPHANDHRIGMHTVAHVLAGSEHACDALPDSR